MSLFLALNQPTTTPPGPLVHSSTRKAKDSPPAQAALNKRCISYQCTNLWTYSISPTAPTKRQMKRIIFLTIIAAVQGGLAFVSKPSSAGWQPGKRKIMTSMKANSDQLAQGLLSYARKVGPVGSLASESERKDVEELAKKLARVKGDPRPSKAPLRGTHNLVYSAAPGGSSGRLIGPLYGKVTQEFLGDDKTFINAVRVGPLEISLEADRIVKDDKTNVVKFRKSRIKLFGNTIVEKEVSGGGTWKYLFMGEVKDNDGKPRLLRVMETPSLFVIEQPL